MRVLKLEAPRPNRRGGPLRPNLARGKQALALRVSGHAVYGPAGRDPGLPGPPRRLKTGLRFCLLAGSEEPAQGNYRRRPKEPFLDQGPIKLCCFSGVRSGCDQRAVHSDSQRSEATGYLPPPSPESASESDLGEEAPFRRHRRAKRRL